MASLHIPTSTYRLQLSGEFRFTDARALVPYLHDLGITDMYASPILQARRGSSHGYDVTDPARLNPDIGSEEEFEGLIHEIRRHGMGLLLDIVPNHLAASIENPWWVDVLENGPGSAYSAYFDIDWHPPNKALDNKVLLPLLSRPYAQSLENRELTLLFEDNGFFIRYADTKLPVAPKSYGFILSHRIDDLKRTMAPDAPAFRELTGILAAVADLPERVALSTELSGTRRLQRGAIKERLGRLYRNSPEIRSFVDENLRIFNGAARKRGSFLLLDELLTLQAYVLSFWQAANEEINYRRFFAITDLVGVRVEDSLVFDATHARIIKLVEKGEATGLRIDHIDGLRDPLGYLRRLQECLTPGGPDAPERPSPGFYVVVEKILGNDEALPTNWQTFGTTGYDFLNVLSGIFVDAHGFRALENTYARFLRTITGYDDLVYEKKKQVMVTILAVEMRALGHHLSLLAGEDRYARDLSMADLTQTLIEVTACLPVYRTYVRNSSVTPVERRTIQRAIKAAQRRNPGLSSVCFAFLEDVLALRAKPHLSPRQSESRLDFVMRWQQFSGPIMAKGVEDTALYIYNPLVSLNEVGGTPHCPEAPVAVFHEFCRKRAKQWPHTLNATSTHDTKRSEDVRARISVLSELPAEWSRHMRQWARWNSGDKETLGERPVPDHNEEILLYQTMLGAWPFLETEVPEFKKRLQAYMVKAMREARVHTKWSRPNIKHEKALSRFIESILEKSNDNRFLKDFLRFQRKISHYGALNALAQAMIKMTAPGVPDFYQGSELWDLRLVDPDNRGPVDFKRRIELLAELKTREDAAGLAFLDELLAHWEDGRIKLYLTARTLSFRRSHPELFQEGDYLPVKATGAKKDNVCAYIRHKADAWILTATPRLATQLAGEREAPLGNAVWENTALTLPGNMPRVWKNVFTQEALTVSTLKGKRLLPMADVLRRFPVAMLQSGAT
ncbi:MAG: malto-oligosyltrehalose synthase [Terriglobia bacterium]